MISILLIFPNSSFSNQVSNCKCKQQKNQVLLIIEAETLFWGSLCVVARIQYANGTQLSSKNVPRSLFIIHQITKIHHIDVTDQKRQNAQ